MIAINPTIKECDVLIVGGGIGGMMAAIAAADAGVSVIIAEKADTRRSGSGATGNDHFFCYIPEKHGDDIERIMKELADSQVGPCSEPFIQRKFLERSFEVVQDWQKWGINMRPHNDWEFYGHNFPERTCITLKYDGQNQKRILTKQAQERGVKIENHTPITEFLSDSTGNIIGAIGLDVSKAEPELKLFKAKSIVTATGIGMRLYPSTTPGIPCNLCNCPAGTAAGRVAAYKIGATLVNIDTLWIHAGPKHFERCGKGTWIGVLTDCTSKPIGPFVTKPNRNLGDITGDVWKTVFSERNQAGTGPTFMDCSQAEAEDIDYMTWGFRCEGVTSIIDSMEQQDINFDQHKVEFDVYKPNLQGRGIQIDINAATNVPGLFCAGDESGNFNAGIGGAAVTGRIAGESAAAYVKGMGDSQPIENHPLIAETQKLYSSFMERKTGAGWKELNLALQQIMDEYCGITFVRSETLLSSALIYLDQLEQYAKKEIMCSNAHELMRTVESLELLIMGKLVCTAARERKETRGTHKRSDYAFINPLFNDQFLTITKVDDQPKATWRKIQA